MKPRLLDLFCCAGGATRGYQLAGWHVTGVDLVKWDGYPGDEFIKADALVYGLAHGHEYDAIAGSPPCQGEGAPTKGTNRARNAAAGREHPRLIGPLRQVLKTTGRPWVIENVAGSTVRKDIRLCGEMFGLGVLQHRYFELDGWSMTQPAHPRHRGRVRGWRHGAYYDGPYVAAYGKGGGKATVAEMQAAKRIDWTDDEVALREAIPPAFAELLGRALMAELERRAAA